MQAILVSQFVNDFSQLRPVQQPLPVPQPNQYLVKVTHISPAHVDILHANGRHQNVSKRGNVKLPFIVGYDFVGLVAEMPKQASSQHKVLRKGTRVMGSAIGAFAEYVAVGIPALQEIPENVTSTMACAAVGQAVSYAAVARVARVKPGQMVMISGASGGLGSFQAMIAKSIGAKVIALTSDRIKVDKIRQMLRVDDVFCTEGDWIQKVLQATNGKGVDAVFDNTGMVDDALRCLCNGGTIVVLGFTARDNIMENLKVNKILLKSAKVIGYRHGETSRRDPAELARVWEEYLDLLRKDALKPNLYGNYHGLKDVGRAFSDLHAHKVFGKIVIPLGAEMKPKL